MILSWSINGCDVIDVIKDIHIILRTASKSFSEPLNVSPKIHIYVQKHFIRESDIGEFSLNKSTFI